jgi:hypothetical protein
MDGVGIVMFVFDGDASSFEANLDVGFFRFDGGRGKSEGDRGGKLKYLSTCSYNLLAYC